jgi:hypothetical protein
LEEILQEEEFQWLGEMIMVISMMTSRQPQTGSSSSSMSHHHRLLLLLADLRRILKSIHVDLMPFPLLFFFFLLLLLLLSSSRCSSTSCSTTATELPFLKPLSCVFPFPKKLLSMWDPCRATEEVGYPLNIC